MAIGYGTYAANQTAAFGSVSIPLALSGVTSGQPIVVFFSCSKYFSGSFATTWSDTFSTPYTWTVILNLTSAADANAQLGILVGTGGSGTSGTITIGGATGGGSSGKLTFLGGFALPLTGASLGSGAAIVNNYGYVDSSAVSVSSLAGPSITPTVAGSLALWFTAPLSGTITVTMPSSPWTTIETNTNTNEPSVSAIINPSTSAALNPTFSYSNSTEAFNGGILILPPSATSAPTLPITSNVPVQRAANWFKRASGLWSPESGLIPRAA